MELVVDLHVHSRYSRATSKDCTLAGLYKWGKIKGINIIGTGDFTHPAWFAELREQLEPADPGLFKLKDEIAKQIDKEVPASCRDNLIRFVPSVEIACIYSKAGRVRKLHNLLVAPSLESVAKINDRLSRIGNLKADGRPILGLDSKELLKITLESDPTALFIPAHIWTPWFGMFGSRSGFDSLEEAFEELAGEIKIIETGLSSDPAMNRRVSQLDGVTVTSNSDAHSPQKLGREASVVNCQVSYADIAGAFKTNDERFVGTIEFFPEEGKYHYDGHRACGVRFTPAETRGHKGICPVCGKPLTVGVDYRVEELADRPGEPKASAGKQVEYIIPLAEIIAEIKNVKSVSSAAVTRLYHEVINRLGDEFSVLRSVPIETIRAAGFSELASAITKMRGGDVLLDPGYDGVYGTIKVLKNKQEQLSNQTSLLP
ncbi:MAG TPA: endonuclease Q family protein [Candidatus Saccharimonadales bacterium]|nr:endonuclease Q family protein [Candidatus Saccharimonadales bacterium]